MRNSARRDSAVMSSSSGTPTDEGADAKLARQLQTEEYDRTPSVSLSPSKRRSETAERSESGSPTKSQRTAGAASSSSSNTHHADVDKDRKKVFSESRRCRAM